MCAPPALCKVIGTLAISYSGGLDYGKYEVPTRLALANALGFATCERRHVT